MKLNKEVLDRLEKRFLQGVLGEVEAPASVLDIIRRVLVDCGRLVYSENHDGDSDYLDDAEPDELESNILQFGK
jgi:hypothetical protein